MKVILGNILCLLLVLAIHTPSWALVIGFNYPETGPYAKEGLDEKRGAELAVEEINRHGGILGKKIQLEYRDTQSNQAIARENAEELYDMGAPMILGGSSSAVAIAVGDVAHQKNQLFFATLTYSMDTTGKAGYRNTFRECYDSWMAAQALGGYLRQQFPNKKYFYITADYTWGWTTEAALRVSTDTVDAEIHGGTKTPFPNAEGADFGTAFLKAQRARAEVVVLVLFGEDFTKAIHYANIVNRMRHRGVQLVVPNLTLAMAEGAGPEAMEGVIGAVPWEWNVPKQYPAAGEKGDEFVKKFAAIHHRYPSSPAASAYTILHEYKAAVERAGTFKTDRVIKALEGHKYTAMKDEQYWRKLDHQSVQSVFLVQGKPESEVFKDKFKLDYFKILKKFEGPEVVIPEDLWRWQRLVNGKPGKLD